MDVEDEVAQSRSKENGAAPPPAVSPALKLAHELLLKNAEDIKSGENPGASKRCTVLLLCCAALLLLLLLLPLLLLLLCV